MRRVLILCGLLAACTATGTGPRSGPATVEEVILYRDNLTVEMSDGRLCTGVRNGPLSGWRGALGGCPYPLPFTVSRAGKPAPRVVLREGIQGPISVQITTDTGVLTFGR